MTESVLDRAALDLRQLIGDVAAALVCVWTGYFLCHTWQTLDTTELALLAVGVSGCYAATFWAVADERRRVIGALLAVAALAAAGLGDVRATAGAGLLACLALLRATGAERMPEARFLFGCLFAGAAVCTGQLEGFPVSGLAGLCTVGLMCYVGLVWFIRGRRPIEKGTFAIALALMIALVLLVAGLGVGRPFGLLAAAFSVYLAVYLGWYGRQVLRRFDLGRVGLFAETVLPGAGLFAGALLALHVPKGDKVTAELAWPVISATFAVVMMRVWPFLRRQMSGDGRRKPTN